MKQDEISQPVRTPSGYSIIEVVDITPSQQLAYDSVKEQIRSKLLSERETEAWNVWLTETMQKLGVVYRSGYAPPDAVTAAPTSSTTLPGQPGSVTTVSERGLDHYHCRPVASRNAARRSGGRTRQPV